MKNYSVDTVASLTFYGDKNYADGNTGHIAVTHGGTGPLAISAEVWTYQSVEISAMQAMILSTVNTADTATSYLSHTESLLTASVPDLTALYSAAQFPLNYLGLDPTIASVVWLDIDNEAPAPNAIAMTALVGGSITTATTLSLPARPGVLAIVSLIPGSTVIANCEYGNYDCTAGTVVWTGFGALALEYLDGGITLVSATGFPAGWNFSAPAMQGDGSWRVTLTITPANNVIIASLSADKTSIIDDGTDTITLMPVVIDSVSDLPVAKMEVTWGTTVGSLSSGTSITDGNGKAAVTLTSRQEGTGRIFTRLDTGSMKLLDITVNHGLRLYSDTNWQGDSSTLPEHNSAPLRDAASGWLWRSAKLNGEHLFSYTAFQDPDTFDFRKYADGYAVADAADLTVGYPVDETAGEVQGIVLSEDDIIIRVTLLPSVTHRSLVAETQQSYPVQVVTASVTNGDQRVEGVLAIFNKNAPQATIPLSLRQMDPDTGLVERGVNTSLLVRWDAQQNEPMIELDPETVPEGWMLWPAHATGNAGEYTTMLMNSITLALNITVRGTRGMDMWYTGPGTLMALDMDTMKPAKALWQYEGDSQWVETVWFNDIRPDKALHVRGGEVSSQLTLRPCNIAGTGDPSAVTSFAALTDDGRVQAWGGDTNGGIVPAYIASRSDLVCLTGNYGAFAALTASGGVVAWGNPDYASNVPEIIASRTDLVNLTASQGAFAALTTSGGAVAWGNSIYGGKVPEEIASRTDLVYVVSNNYAFAALTASGGALTWGNQGVMNFTPPDIATRTDLVSLVGCDNAFAALTASGGVIAWGTSADSGNVPPDIAIRTDLKNLVAGHSDFAVLTYSGHVMTWGDSTVGIPDDIAGLRDLMCLNGSAGNFSALTASGGVVGWGDSRVVPPPEIANRTDLVGLCGNFSAFAALTAPGGVVAWGSESYGGVIPEETQALLTNVVAVYSNFNNFIALKSDNTVVVWGGDGAGDMNNVPAALQGNISYQEE